MQVQRSGESAVSQNDERHAFHGLIGASPCMQALFKRLNELAGRTDPVLIAGETGSGKTLAAKALHRAGRFRNESLHVITAGHLLKENGSDSLAVCLDRDPGGTVCIDYIERLLPGQQQALFSKITSLESVNSTRFVAIAHTELTAMVADGRFREDLFVLLSTTVVNMPPLRERLDDLALLVENFRAQLNERLNRNVRWVSDEALAHLRGYSWPGNVGELERVIEQCFHIVTGSIITRSCLPAVLGIPHQTALPPGIGLDSARQELLDALAWAGWNKAKAARKLHISRETLYRRMQKHALQEPEEYRV